MPVLSAIDLQVSNDAVGQTCLLRLSIPSGQRSIKERCLCEERQACLLDLERGAVGTLFRVRNREDRGENPRQFLRVPELRRMPRSDAHNGTLRYGDRRQDSLHSHRSVSTVPTAARS